MNTERIKHIKCGATFPNDIAIEDPGIVSHMLDRIHTEVGVDLMRNIKDGEVYIIWRNDKEDKNCYLCETEITTTLHAVELIRCEDCKYAEVVKDSLAMYTCPFHPGIIWPFDSYCSWAERKEE